MAITLEELLAYQSIVVLTRRLGKGEPVVTRNAGGFRTKSNHLQDFANA